MLQNEQLTHHMHKLSKLYLFLQDDFQFFQLQKILHLQFNILFFLLQMSLKRSNNNRPDIDQKTLQVKQIDQQSSDNRATKQQLKKRNLFQITQSKQNKNEFYLVQISSNKDPGQNKGKQKYQENNQSNNKNKIEPVVQNMKSPLMFQSDSSKLQNVIERAKQQTLFSIFENGKQTSLFKDGVLSSVFKNSTSSQGIGLFGKKKSDNSSLFNHSIKQKNEQEEKKAQSTKNVFNQTGINLLNPRKKQNQNKQSKNSQDQQEEREEQFNSQQFQKDQQIQTDKSKSKVNYVYKEMCKSYFSKIAKKVKIDRGNLLQNIEICIQEDLATKIKVVRIQTTMAKIIKFEGLILQKSSLNILYQKVSNIEIGLFILNKNQNGPKVQKHLVKIQFQRDQHAESFQKVFQDILKDLAKNKNTQQTSQNEKQASLQSKNKQRGQIKIEKSVDL